VLIPWGPVGGSGSGGASWRSAWGGEQRGRSRQDESIERRPEEQGTQDAHKTQLRGYGFSLQWPLNEAPSLLRGCALGFGAGRSPARAPRSGAGAGGGRGGDIPAIAAFAPVLGGRGSLGLPGGPNGPKPILCAQLGAARSRQDESKEVHEAGSKRPSSGCNGVHVVWWIGLIFRLLFVAWSLVKRASAQLKASAADRPRKFGPGPPTWAHLGPRAVPLCNYTGTVISPLPR
jgi:hypothetical protein